MLSIPSGGIWRSPLSSDRRSSPLGAAAVGTPDRAGRGRVRRSDCSHPGRRWGRLGSLHLDRGGRSPSVRGVFQGPRRLKAAAPLFGAYRRWRPGEMKLSPFRCVPMTGKAFHDCLLLAWETEPPFTGLDRVGHAMRRSAVTEQQNPGTQQDRVAKKDAQPQFKGRKNGPYKDVSPELAAWMRTGWADTERRDLEPIEQAAYTAKRRATVSARFPGERLVIPAGNLKTRSNDTDYPFRAASDYVYLTGDQSEDGCLVFEPREDGGHDVVLYLRPRSSRENGEFWLDGYGELWVGRRNSLAEAAALYGLPTRDVRTLPDVLRQAPEAPTRIVRGHDATLEAVLTLRRSAEDAGTAEEAARRDAELAVFLHDARLVKDEWEIGQLQRAVDSTVRGFGDVVRVLPQAQATSERYIEGTFFLRARVEGNDVGYGTIAASGPNATTLHWVRNDGPVRPGDLLLLDAGVETTTLYTADVTRTIPASGRFSDV